MKRTTVCIIAVSIALVLFPSCGPNAIQDEVDAQIVSEAVIAALTPVIDSNFTMDAASARALFPGYTQSGGGTIAISAIAEPEWGSQYPIPASDSNLTLLVTMTDFVVPLGAEEYTINAVVTFDFAYIIGATDRDFIFTVWGSGVAISGGDIEDTFDLDMQAAIDIDIICDATDCSTAVSGSLSGVIAGVSIELSTWSFAFDFVDPHPI